MPYVRFKDGSAAIICSRTVKLKPVCQECGDHGYFQCDWPVEYKNHRGETIQTTCSIWMCLKHSNRVAFNTDYCRRHFEEYEAAEDKRKDAHEGSSLK